MPTTRKFPAIPKQSAPVVRRWAPKTTQPQTTPSAPSKAPIKPQNSKSRTYAPVPPPPGRPDADLAQKAATKARIQQWRQTPLVIMGLLTFGVGLYATQLYISLTKDPELKDLPEDLIDRFDKEATGYDEKVNTAEWLLGTDSLRKKITEQARGHVLEVAVGTGRNFAYYKPTKCDTVTLLDYSEPMLAVARRKWKEQQMDYFKRVTFKRQSALDPITPPFGAQDGYDTVLQTMGLCSTPEPVRLLRNLGSVTKEDGGQILLLEHGRSHYQWLNSLLDKTAPAHANEHGCWWNKDIGKIVEDSGLEVVEIKRYNFGTTWWVQLRPKPGQGCKQQTTAMEDKEKQAPVAPSTQEARQTSWWSLWR